MDWFKKKNKVTIFNDWISEHHGVLYRHALWMSGNQDIAMDMVQDAFFQAWISIDALKDPEKALPWLITILQRVIYKEQRYKYRHSETMAELRQLDSKPVQVDAYPLLEIYSAFESISANLREVFLLHHLHGFSYEEISTQLQIPKGTVMSRMSRAREALIKQDESDNNVVNLANVEKVRLGEDHEK